MPYAETIQRISTAINDSFTEIYPWFQRAPAVLNYRPVDGGWSIAEILEHVTLTSHFLLIVASNGCEKALRRAQSQSITTSESDLTGLAIIGERGSFPWIRPEHMEPQGRALSEVLATMHTQQEQCIGLLK
jgi:hypothetical protein